MKKGNNRDSMVQRGENENQQDDGVKREFDNR